jgi:hypothetical protein
MTAISFLNVLNLTNIEIYKNISMFCPEHEASGQAGLAARLQLCTRRIFDPNFDRITDYTEFVMVF